MRKSFVAALIVAIIGVIIVCTSMSIGFRYIQAYLLGLDVIAFAACLCWIVIDVVRQADATAVAKTVTTPDEIEVHYGHLVIMATVLDMAGPMCIVKIQGRVAPAWLTEDKWVIYQQPFDLLDDPSRNEPTHLDDPYDGTF